jgi:hypothetical protein
VYESLNGLFELGIAEEIVENNYKKIRAYSVGTMRHDLEEKTFHLQRLTKDLGNLEKSILLTVPTASPKSTALRLYKGRSGARQLYWNTLKCKDTVYVYSDWGRGRYVGVKFYENFVIESRKRKIKEKVLINLAPDALESIKEYSYPGSTMARTKIEDIRVLPKKDIEIRGDTLIYDNIYAQVYLKNVKIDGFEIENKNFTTTQRSIFETLWGMAKPMSSFL